MKTISVDPKLKEWGTEKQCQYVDAINEHGGFNAASVALGVNSSTVSRSIKSLRASAARNGYAPDQDLDHPTPEGFAVKGTSTLYGEDGAVKVQWVKTNACAEQQLEQIRETITDWAADLKGLSPIVEPPKNLLDELLCAYPMGDPHGGMYSWARETGTNYDLKEFERLHIGACDRLVSAAPPAKTALLIDLGDFYHADNSSNQTPASGHALDVDSRHPKVFMTGTRVMRHMALRLLEKHNQVHIVVVRGNHDPESSFAMAVCLSAWFENEPRVTVELEPGLFHYFEFGENLFGMHHGHGARPDDLPGIMATDQREAWGRTRFRKWFVGHFHHRKVRDRAQEYRDVEVEIYRTLAPGDAWHKGKGYRAGRDMRCEVYHKTQGLMEMHRCDASVV